GVPNRLRDQPNGAQVGQAAPGASLTVLDGPFCDAENMLIWWQVSADDGDVVGWTVEGFTPDDYFLEPTSAEGIAYGATAVAHATQAAQIAEANATAEAEREQQSAQATRAALHATALASITPSPTFTPSVTPTITPTLPPLRPLPITLEAITPQNVGSLTTLTSLPVVAYQILFAPDGSQVLIGDTVYTLPQMTPAADFLGCPLADGSITAISPDGRYLIYNHERALWLYDTLDAARRPLDKIPYFTDVTMSAGPPYRIAGTYGESYANPGPGPRLLIYNLDSDQLLELDNPANFGGYAAFNRHGTRVSVTGDRVRVVDAVTGNWVYPTAAITPGRVA